MSSKTYCERTANEYIQLQFFRKMFSKTMYQEFFIIEFPHFYGCIFETLFIGEKMQETTVKRFVKVGYNVNFEFQETKFQN